MAPPAFGFALLVSIALRVLMRWPIMSH